MKPSVGNLPVDDTGSMPKRCFRKESDTVSGPTEIDLTVGPPKFILSRPVRARRPK